MMRKTVFKNFAILIILSAALFNSCSFFTHNGKDDSESGLVTVRGSIKENAFLAERTAVPGSTNNTTTYNYIVVAQSKSSGCKKTEWQYFCFSNKYVQMICAGKSGRR